MLDKHSLVTVLDADSITWIVAYNARDKDDVDEVLLAADSFVTNILASTSCTHYIGFLGGSKCFRYDIAVTKGYKSNRPPSPEWFVKWGSIIKAHLRDKWKFIVVNNIEADDAVAIAKTELDFLDINYILSHADKDIRQLSGNHYNIRTHKREYISPLEASKNLYKQILIGDPTDGIEGLKGIGKKKASQYIDGLNTKAEMRMLCQTLFINKYGPYKGRDVFYEMWRLCELLNTSKPYTDLELDYIEVERNTNNTELDTFITEFFN